MAKSIVDYIFRWLGITFIPSYESGDLEAVPVNRLKHTYPRAATSAMEPALVASAVAAGNNGHQTEATTKGVRALNAAMAHFQSDAPPCQNCGTIMVRSGACYQCPGCAESSGCG